MNLAASTLRRPRLPGSVRGTIWVGGAFLLLVLLAGCSSTLSELPAAVGGLPSDAPERPATQAAYPAVHDMPPPRTNTVLTEDEQKKAEAELAAARDQQAKRAATKDQ